MKKLLIVLLIAGILIGVFTLVVKALQTPDPVSYELYVVEKGDTLWSIAHQSDMWNKMDASIIIDDMKEKSDCTSTIYPGQIIYIPMYNN